MENHGLLGCLTQKVELLDKISQNCIQLNEKSNTENRVNHYNLLALQVHALTYMDFRLRHTTLSMVETNKMKDLYIPAELWL